MQLLKRENTLERVRYLVSRVAIAPSCMIVSTIPSNLQNYIVFQVTRIA